MNQKIPIINFSLFEFTRRTCLGGRISLKGAFLIPVYYLQIIPVLPLAFLQSLIFARRIRKTIISKDPVFILGHYRSGTSLLQKLMVSDQRFGFLNYYDALFPNTSLLLGKRMQSVFQGLIHIFKIKNPFFHNSILKLSEPDEEDDYLMNKGSAYSAYWGLIFPVRWREWLNSAVQMSDQKYLCGWKKEYLRTLQYVTFRNNGKPLVLKSPPNTERIRVLLEMFPKAKFIFLSRNPFLLYYSTRNMWKRAILRYYSLQKISEAELDELVFGHFEYLMEQYEKDKHLIPNGNLVEISYEELKTDSFDTIRKIYSCINLPDFEITANNLAAQLEKEKEYQNFYHPLNAETFERINHRWENYIQRGNYKVPEIISK